VRPFQSSLEHVLAELERVDLFLRLQVQRARQFKGSDDRFEGLYVSDQEVDAICSQPAGLPRWATRLASHEEADLRQAIDQLEAHIASRTAATSETGPVLRLDKLTSLFGLASIDVAALLVCLAPEIDLRYERVFAYLQDDVQKRRPTIDLLLNLLCPTFVDKLKARNRFRASAPLLEHRLIELFEDPSRPRAPMFGKHVRLDDRIADFLLGSDDIDAAIAPYARCVTSPNNGASHANEPLDDSAASIYALAARGPVLVHVQGLRGAGKQAYAAAIAARSGAELLIVDGERVLSEKETPFEVLAQRVAREASLRSASLYWSGFDALLGEDRRKEREALVRVLSRRSGQNYVSGTLPWVGATDSGQTPVLRIALTPTTYAERRQLWEDALGTAATPDVVADLLAVAAKFRFGAQDIRAAAADARAKARLREDGAQLVRSADIYAACRARASKRMGELAKKIEPHFVWDDLILPLDTTRQLREICEQVRQRARVLEEWGFARKLSLGRGLHALFAGPSGTGKTMAAGIMAGELGLDLYKIDLAGVVSKYIGETEKNLARIFAEAETSGAILFFDEADALFGKRSEVKDAHDRYANIETSFLLQRMEEYEGITILATNLRRNMDEAFLRRLAFAVQFPVPDESDRLRIWESVFPAETPRGVDVDLRFMAKQFKMTGGSIRNVALAAAYLAATDGESVGMAQLIRATRRELQKMGQAFAGAEFGEHGHLVELAQHQPMPTGS
jgi:SpoVK/Ycf46/Vps4 family AAA+-type ATPase